MSHRPVNPVNVDTTPQLDRTTAALVPLLSPAILFCSEADLQDANLELDSHSGRVRQPMLRRDIVSNCDGSPMVASIEDNAA